ncbi:MerR family transcriptional regulator [Mycoplasmatota bacterium]|nr:MerR family transcriptional regulator [Mycoplasmatota bacterium]
MLKIGDFSKLTRVSIRMLRHYDEKGLLKPERIDKFTGYRFYSIEQIPKVNRIQALKEMGFSLSEIYELMARNLDSKQLRILLENRKREILTAIDHEKGKLIRVKTLIKSIEKENLNMNYDITIKTIPSYKVLSLRDIIPAYNAEGKLWEELQKFAKNNNIKGNTPCYAIYHDTEFKESDVDVEVTMCINDEVPENNRIKIRELEEVLEMAVVFHHGPFEEMTSAYQALGEWMESNGYEMNGPTRAIYHKGPWCEEDSANYLTEIQAPVVKK